MWTTALTINSILFGLSFAVLIFFLGSALLLEGSWKAAELAFICFVSLFLSEFAFGAFNA